MIQAKELVAFVVLMVCHLMSPIGAEMVDIPEASWPESTMTTCNNEGSQVLIVDTMNTLKLQIGLIKMCFEKQNLITAKQLLCEINNILQEQYVPLVNKLANVSQDSEQEDSSAKKVDPIPSLIRQRRHLRRVIRQLSASQEQQQEQENEISNLVADGSIDEASKEILRSLSEPSKVLLQNCIRQYQFLQHVIKFQRYIDNEVGRIIQVIFDDKRLGEEVPEPSTECTLDSIRQKVEKFTEWLTSFWHKIIKFISTNPICFALIPLISFVCIYLLTLEMLTRFKQ